MQQVAKVASPIIVLLGLLIFRENQSNFIQATVLLISSIGILSLVCKPIREHPKSTGILLFWLSPIAVLWLLSERKEGRDISSASIICELVLAGLGTIILVSKESLKKSDVSLFCAIFLTWAVAYLSGSTGGADNMFPMFDFLGLTVDQVNNLIVIVRKTIHVSFYGSLTWFFANFLRGAIENRKVLFLFSFALPFSVSISDEFRQSMMANRQGSISDVILDMSATFLVLLFVTRSKTKVIA